MEIERTKEQDHTNLNTKRFPFFCGFGASKEQSNEREEKGIFN